MNLRNQHQLLQPVCRQEIKTLRRLINKIGSGVHAQLLLPLLRMLLQAADHSFIAAAEILPVPLG
ncbi:hypothetical protein D3C75_1354960 [compost metagenome]